MHDLNCTAHSIMALSERRCIPQTFKIRTSAPEMPHSWRRPLFSLQTLFEAQVSGKVLHSALAQNVFDTTNNPCTINLVLCRGSGYVHLSVAPELVNCQSCAFQRLNFGCEYHTRLVKQQLVYMIIAP